MRELERIQGMLRAMASVLEDAPGILGYKVVTPEMVREASRRAGQWLAEHPADEDDSGLIRAFTTPPQEPGSSSGTGGRGR